MMYLKNVPWVKVNEEKDKIKTVLIPVGAIEAYGPHLPLGTDGIVVEKVAKLLTERIPAFVSPLIPAGYSRFSQDYPGCLSISPTALSQYLYYVAESLLRLRPKRVLFLNGHAGNVAPIAELMGTLEDKYPNVLFVQIDFWRFVEPIAKRIFKGTENPLGHAGETMTSVMLYLAPEMVCLQNIKFPVSSVKHKPAGLIRPRKLNPRETLAVLGNPTAATAEKGQEIISYTLNEIVRVLNF